MIPNHQFKPSNLGSIPEDWKRSRFQDICTVHQELQIAIAERLKTPTKTSKEYITIRSINNANQEREYIESPSSRVWRLPDGDSNYPLRWRLIKHYVAMGLHTSTNHRGEKKVWQRRLGEHTITHEQDWRNHMNYIHFNPVKRGYVESPRDWKYSSFSRAVSLGWYHEDWGQTELQNILGVGKE